MNSKQGNSAATSLVAAGTVLSGDITFRQELVIAGTVNGSVICDGEDTSVVKILKAARSPVKSTLQGWKLLVRSMLMSPARAVFHRFIRRSQRCDSFLQAGS